MHAVHTLYQYRKSISTKPFNARGKKVERCELCQCAKANCICSLKPKLGSNAGFLLLMHDIEVLKPSNTGRLIADLIPDTFAYFWQRTTVEDSLLALLGDPQWQPFVVFPEKHVKTEQIKQGRQVFCNSLPTFLHSTKVTSKEKSKENKRPLFILLDGSWKEAKKMFGKSPYLDKLPVLSLSADIVSEEAPKQHYIRQAELKHQFATAQVAAQLLTLFGESYNADVLNTWFDVFNYRYQQSVCQKNLGDSSAISRLEKLIKEK